MEDQPSEFVPLVGRVIASGVMKNFARSDDVVAIVSKVFWNGYDVWKIWIPPVPVVVQAGRRWPQSSHNRGSRWSTFGGRAMRIRKQRSPFRQPIYVWRVNDAFVSA